MKGTQRKNSWDAAAQEERWHKATEQGRRGLEKFGEQLSISSTDFYILCLAEVDAAQVLMQPQCLASRAAFVAEIKRLIAEPTMPSRPVASVETYRGSQKWWLEFLLEQYESETEARGPE
jgi:hypothetical protein